MSDLDKVAVEASFEDIDFPVTDCPFQVGRDGVEHTVVAKDGSDCEDTGGTSYKGTLTIPLLNGLAGFETIELFPGLMRELLGVLGLKPIGRLVHPLLGPLTAWMHSVSVDASAEVRNGVTVKIEWIEHRATVQLFAGASGEEPTDAAQSVVSQADAADVAMAEAMPDGGYESMADTADTQLAVIEAPSSRPSDIEAAVRTITTTIDANLDLADLQTVEAAQAILELERLRARAYDLRDSLLVGLRRANVLTVPRTMSVFELSLQAYGDATQMQLLLDANPAIAADPLFVAPGTIVTIPPLN